MYDTHTVAKGGSSRDVSPSRMVVIEEIDEGCEDSLRAAEDFKAQGNAAFKAARNEDAVTAYSEGVRVIEAAGVQDEAGALLVTLCANMAAAQLKLEPLPRSASLSTIGM